MTPKKIVILDTGKEWGGGTNSLIELLRRIDKRRFSFTAVFYDNYKKGGVSDIKTEIERQGAAFIQLARPKASAAVKAKKEVARAVLSLSPALKKEKIFEIDLKERIMPMAGRIAQILKEAGADLLYMNNQPSSNLEGILAGRQAGVKCVQHSRVEILPTPFEAKAVNDSVDKVICVSSGVKDALVKGGVQPSRCAVVHNGIDASLKPKESPAEIRKKYSIPADAFLTGTVGSLIGRKRVDMLVSALAELKKTGKAYALIVGEGPEEARLKAAAKRLDIEKEAVFTGFSIDAPSMINAMDAFVLASEEEGLPRVILEAMLMSRPVVAFDVTGPSELVKDGETGFLLERQDPLSLALALGRLRDNPELGKRLGKAGRERVVSEFSIEKYVSGVEKVLSEVLF